MIVILDFGMGNPGSILNMFRYIGVEAVISSDIDEVGRATRIVLPGVGAFEEGMERLRSGGFLAVLERKVRRERVPILGICLGLQLMTSCSEEGPGEGLGWFDAATVRFSEAPGLKVPHMGWNTVALLRPHPLLDELPADHRFYFAHSFHVACRRTDDLVAVSRHGREFGAVLACHNVMGTQFHPEKSHRYGMLVLRNFARFPLAC